MYLHIATLIDHLLLLEFTLNLLLCLAKHICIDEIICHVFSTFHGLGASCEARRESRVVGGSRAFGDETGTRVGQA